MSDGLDIASRRLSVLELADRLGNVAEACRRSRMDRSSFYEWRRRFQALGFDGLKGIEPRVAVQAPRLGLQDISPDLAERIETLALEHAANDCRRIEALLLLEGYAAPASVIQDVLANRGLGTAEQRWLRLEQSYADGATELSRDQVAFVERFNPGFRERCRESSVPGQVLCQTAFLLGAAGEIKLYLHAAIDTYGGYAFGLLHESRRPEAAVALLHNDVFPFYRRRGLAVHVIATDERQEFRGGTAHPFALYLALNDIGHRRYGRRAQPNGFVQRFVDKVRRDLLHGRRAVHGAEALTLRASFDAWLHRYNCEYPQPGYRNYGRTPLEMMQRA